MKTIGKYQAVEEIGHSAAGVTYHARDAFKKTDLALKVLGPLTALSVEAKDQLYGHLGSCADLAHRNIAKIQDVGEADGGVYIATDLLTGSDLRNHLAGAEPAADPQQTIAQHLTLIAQVCEGLAGAHAHFIVHGNIKPSNIFVLDGRDAVILDFGVGYLQNLLIAAGTRLDGLLPNYLAPEQILGEHSDARSDVYSVATVLYEIIAGRYPFDVPAGVIPREIVHSDPRPLRELNPHAPEELERVLIRALMKDPAKRPESAKELAAVLYTCAQQLRKHPAAPAVEAQPAPTAFQTPITEPEPPLPVEIAPPTAPVQAELPPPPPTAKPEPPPAASIPVMPAVPPVPAAAAPACVPQKQPLAKSVKVQRGVATLIVAAALAFWVTSAVISHSSLKASEDKVSTPAAQVPAPVKTAPEPPPVVQAAPPEPEPEKPAAKKAESAAPAFTPFLRSRVKTLWEAGRYADAMDLVDNFLAESPANTEAQAWKKRIRAAQDAEAAIK